MSNFCIEIPAEKVDEGTIKELKAEGLPVVVFGAGEVGEEYTAKLKRAGLEVYCAVSEGFTKPEGVYYPQEIDAILPTYNLVPGFREAIIDDTGKFSGAYEAFRNKKRIVFIINYHEVNGIEEITADYFREHYEDYERLYDLLADEKSRESYKVYLSVKLSENYSQGANLIETPTYFSGDFLSFNKEEVFVDCGAYDGDSIRDFEKYVIQRRVGGGQDLCI